MLRCYSSVTTVDAFVLQVLMSEQRFASQIDSLKQMPLLPTAVSRVAIVMVSGPQSAEAAVRELHGCCVQGNTLRVEHIRRAVGGRRASASISGPQSSKDSTAPETSKTERKVRV